MFHKTILILVMVLLLSACKSVENETQLPINNNLITVADSNGQNISLEKFPEKVFSLSSSFAEIWQLAGGEISGVTNDAITDNRILFSKEPLALGTIKDPNIEIILSEQPDFVILSQDITSHSSIAETLNNTNIPCYIAKVETFEDYLKVLADFSTITGNKEDFYENGELVKKEINALLARLPKDSNEKKKTALFLRAFASDVKVKARDHTVCYILSDIGVENIASRQNFPLEELSMEAIIEANPDYIFIVPMGDEEAAKTNLEKSLYSNPAWSSLTAVKTGNMIMLSKNLFHYKPNNKWGEAYETILRIVYPEIYGK